VKKFVKAISLILALCLCICCKEEFAIKGISPPTGALGGGEPIQILGSGFDANQGLAVYFGSIKANNVTVAGPKKLIVSSPASGDAKIVDIRISTDNGKEYRIPRAFRYVKKTTMDIRDLGARRSMREKQQ